MGPQGKLVTEYGAGQCGNCHKEMAESDKYCRYCGTKRGDGAFLPYDNTVWCIYGPRPVERKHKCENCAHEWSTVLMVDDQKYCPVCGSAAPVTETEFG